MLASYYHGGLWSGFSSGWRSRRAEVRGVDVRDAIIIWATFWVLAMALWLDVEFFGGILGRISTSSMDIHGDFDTFWRSAAALWEGGDVYDTGARLTNLNPPLWILLISPLGLLEPLVAYRVFAVITLTITIGYLVWMADELRLRPLWAVVGVVMLLLSSPLLATLALGQIYPVLALGLVAAWVADRRGRTLISGGALGLVVALKPSLAPCSCGRSCGGGGARSGQRSPPGRRRRSSRR
jgi:hypothetical protein